MQSRFSRVFVLGLPLLAISCGSSSGSKVDGAVIHTGDSGTKDGVVACQAMSTYGSAQTFTQQVVGDDAAMGSGSSAQGSDVEYFGAFNSAATPDGLEVDLFDGFGAFANGSGSATGIKAGTYQLTGDEIDFASCGACVLIDTQVTISSTAFSPSQQYLAMSGTLTLTAVAPTLTGTLTNATFKHVDIDSSTEESTDDPDGCSSAITSISFTAKAGSGSGSSTGG